MRRTDITLLFAMGGDGSRALAGFANAVSAKLPCPNVRLRLVGYGRNARTAAPLVSVQPYVDQPEDIMHQVVELAKTPFAAAEASPEVGIRGVFAGLKCDGQADLVVLVVADAPRGDSLTGNALVEELRAAKVQVRCVAWNNPAAVVSVLKERSGGYVRVVERRDRMTILARYSCQYGPQEREFADCVLRQLLEFKPEIDVERFTLPVGSGGLGWSISRVLDLYDDVLWNNPQVFYVNKRAIVRWCGNGDNGARFTRITDFTYAIEADDYERCRKELETVARQAIADIEGCGDSVAKALYLHDYIVRHCEYDVRGKGNPLPIYRTAYDVLVRHRAVCEGYVMAYRYLLAMVGIESEEVVSAKMKHCWSYLHLGENWYHVDVTWDDPVWIGGRKPVDADISHRYFLLSDAAMRRNKHYDWNVRGLPVADDRRYDRVDWQRR